MKVSKLIGSALVCAAFSASISAQEPQTGQVQTGKSLYEDNCAVCHQFDGGGVPFMQPELFGSKRANSPKGGVIDMILFGSAAEGAGQSGFTNEMPGFEFLTNEEIALIATYVRINFENNGGAVTADDVQPRRK